MSERLGIPVINITISFWPDNTAHYGKKNKALKNLSLQMHRKIFLLKPLNTLLMHGTYSNRENPEYFHYRTNERNQIKTGWVV